MSSNGNGNRFNPFSFWQLAPQWVEASMNQAMATMYHCQGMFQYFKSFLDPLQMATNQVLAIERTDSTACPWNKWQNYAGLMQFAYSLAMEGFAGGTTKASDFHTRHIAQAFDAWTNTFFHRENGNGNGNNSETYVEYTRRLQAIMRDVAIEYPEAIRNIKSQYGLHLDNGGYTKIAETDRAELYQVLPLDGSDADMQIKPVCVKPPFVLGPNILAFLPGEKKSYLHTFANQKIPTYVIIVKDIATTPSVQTMTGEDDALDMRFFLEKIRDRHKKPATLNGICQGAYLSLAYLLSGELDGLVDTFISIVGPMDGTEGGALTEYLESIPPEFRKMGYALKTLPSGNQVVNAHTMSLTFKMKSMRNDAPIANYYADACLLDKGPGKAPKISNTGAALNHWMIYDRTDLSEKITKINFDCYTVPIRDGILPTKLFGHQLDLKRLKAKGIKWGLWFAEKDDLVVPKVALAPTKHIEIDLVVAFTKGHGGAFTSWPVPGSECDLVSEYEIKSGPYKGIYPGPVYYHLKRNLE